VTSARPVLEVRSLSVAFGDEPGLADVSFAVGEGERFALVGASGSGKTSLLRAISGDGRVAAGSVRVDARDVTGAPPEARGVVLLAQTPLLFPHLSVFENVAFPLRVRQVGDAELRDRVESALVAVRLPDFGPRRPATLSGGQARRVALARAVVARPPVLLLDEPLSALDPALRDELRTTILALHADYRPALVMVTHDLDEAGQIGDRIGVLIDGTLAQIGPPETVFRRPATPAVARFLGLPNEIELGGRTVIFGADGAELVDGVDLANGAEVVGGAGPDSEASAATSHPFAGEVVAVRHRPDGVTVVVVTAVGRIEVLVRGSMTPLVGRRVGVRLLEGRLHTFRAGE